ncbi:MAG: protein-disulfide reductase DsbD [Pseudomonadota bacterium]|nr:protein-disulfide reductase DsbD [Pseudomonadota bacterium]
MKRTTLMTRTLLAVLLLLTSVHAWPQDDLLEPDKAFALAEPVISADKITLKWKIAPGYYLYQNKFTFELKGSSSRLDKPLMPEAIRKQDEFFGEVKIYKKSVTIELPVIRADKDAENTVLKVVSQGCNEPIGVCYPPLSKELKISFPAASANPATPSPSPAVKPSSAPATRSGLASLLGQSSAESEFLPPDEAFQLSVISTSSDTVTVSLLIAENYYLYRDKFVFESATPGVSIKPYQLPAGDIKEDEFVGRTEVYHFKFEIDLALAGKSADGKFQLIAKYQGCADNGICYPPITKTVGVPLGVGTSGAAEAADSAADIDVSPGSMPAGDSLAEVSEEQSVMAMLAGGSVGSTIIAFFLFGLALSLTPCVFPMIPILSGIIVGQGADITRKKAFMLSVVYVLGMTIMYTFAGMLAGLTGELLSSAFQSTWVLAVSALVFVLLSFSMFGFYEIQLPAALQTRLTEKSNKIPGGAYSGVFVMGALSALIIGPCVAAPLSGALLYIGQSGDFLLGGIALFVMSLGMGVPLLLIGASAGSLLPKAGTWMNAVKAVFGVLMLAVAIWLLERILPSAITMALWAALLIVSATYMRAFDALPDPVSGWQRFWKGMAIIIMLYGVALFIGSLTGATDVLNPLEKVSGTTQYVSMQAGVGQAGAELEFEEVKGLPALDAAVARAVKEGKPVFVDFFADWCVECVRMENTTFKSPTVVQALAGYSLLRLDLTANDAADKEVLKQFNLFGPPALLFFGLDGQEIRRLRVIGYQDGAEFTATIEKATKAAGL